jgi:RimJ/RimL family protein N-acetyltransferase
MRTERLALRFPRVDDAEVLTAYRNDPEVAALQDWELPYPEERAHDLVARHEDVTDLRPGGRHQVMIEHEGQVVGDLFMGLHEEGGVADLGFTLVGAAQGRGIAHEAASAVIDDLVERLGVHRVVAELSTENRFEGTKNFGAREVLKSNISNSHCRFIIKNEIIRGYGVELSELEELRKYFPS